jgi:tRNA(fMet)-specific endonuclease VapC
MNFLLDTNVCIAVMNRRPISTRSRLSEVIRTAAILSVSAITVVELQYGIAMSRRLKANAETLADFLQPLRLLAFDDQDARIAGSIRAELELRGTPIGAFDCLIAAQGLRHDLCVVTANVREFACVGGLRWENWEA